MENIEWENKIIIPLQIGNGIDIGGFVVCGEVECVRGGTTLTQNNEPRVHYPRNNEPWVHYVNDDDDDDDDDDDRGSGWSPRIINPGFIIPDIMNPGFIM